MTRWSVLPLLVIVGLYALIGPSPVFAAFMAIAAVLPQLFRWRARVGATAQVLIGLVLLGLATAIFATFLPRHPSDTDALPTPWAAFAGATSLVCIVRLYLERPLGGEPLSLALAVAALTACGGVFSDRLYPAAVIVFLVAALVARRQADPTRAPLTTVIRGHPLAIGALAVVTVTLTLVLVRALPAGHAWALRQVMSRAAPAVGFSERLWLGSMRGLLSSSQSVMRVHGVETDHLRSVVFDRYESGRWSKSTSSMQTIETQRETAGGANLVDIEMIDPEPQRYFVPLEAGEITFSSGLARVDANGIFESIQAEPAKRVQFRVSSTGRSRVAPPTPEDTRVPRKIARRLAAIASQVTQGVEGDAAKLAAIEEWLRKNFRYSLEFERSAFNDPVMEFLFQSRHGHCEYFASAMALLARSLRIPARVVGGYRVTELNELGGYYIVRERNAHAWVEAWIDGWQTWDPTPPDELARSAPDRTPWVASLFDLAGNAWSGFLTWLDKRTWIEALGTPLVVIVVGLLIRWLDEKRRSKRRRVAAADEPLACFRALSLALAERGLSRRPDETVERLAQRVAASELPAELAGRASELLLGYSALRYGGRGNASELERDIDALVARLKAQ